MSLPILGLCGNAGSGKNYVASIAATHCQTVEIAFSDPMKRLLNQGLLIDPEILWGESSLREKKLDFLPANLETCFKRGLESFVSDLDKRNVLHGNQFAFLDNCLKWFRTIENNMHKKTCRQLLQELGTDVCRNINKNVWAEYGISTAMSILSYGYKYDPKYGILEIMDTKFPSLVVITDVRFANELVSIKKSGGKVCQIMSSEQKIYQHQSETEQQTIPPSWFDFVLVNNRKTDNNYEKKMFSNRVLSMVKKCTETNWV